MPCCSLCCFFSVWSQNLVKNPSFEDFNKCPEGLGNLASDVHHWSTPTLGSTDYFNGCSVAMGTPENFNGKQPAEFGEGYAGLYLYAPDDYREYLQAELTETLIAGKKYQVSFYISLAERSDFAVKEFGLLFTNKKIVLETRKEFSKKLWYSLADHEYHYMEIGYSNFYSDTKDWLLVHTQFVAKGTEKYLILGNFKNNRRTRLFRTKRTAKQGAYYYLDEVVLKSMDSSNESYEINEVHTFKNLLFSFDKSDLVTTSIAEIDRLYEYLKTNSQLLVSINGHTDTIGTETYNKRLSANRAKAVADYLVKKGIPKERVSWAGHGGTKPIADNSSKSGRELNRRVEFRITTVDDANQK
ncbi:OmpA family protein [Aggregatimonas sangjinii]|uniref:OmpA family protein n=1 Tax=Aggregatimonas sangjinii TaxID=2583587 RepID=A0A5B7SV07_9FLAO|nr:OmpA family protein [Aggregatimonas sangjinii]